MNDCPQQMANSLQAKTWAAFAHQCSAAKGQLHTELLHEDALKKWTRSNSQSTYCVHQPVLGYKEEGRLLEGSPIPRGALSTAGMQSTSAMKNTDTFHPQSPGGRWGPIVTKVGDRRDQDGSKPLLGCNRDSLPFPACLCPIHRGVEGKPRSSSSR